MSLRCHPGERSLCRPSAESLRRESRAHHWRGDNALTGTEVRAFAIHIFTAIGAALALGAMMAAIDSRWSIMFLCLGAALIVDAVDGTLARRFDVAARLPRWSGDVLDLVVDF